MSKTKQPLARPRQIASHKKPTAAHSSIVSGLPSSLIKGIDPRRDNGQRCRGELERRIVENAERQSSNVHSHAASKKTADARSQRLVTRGSLGESALVAGGAQSFHLSSQHNHSRRDAFVFLRGACARTVDRALVNKALKLFISTQAQQLFAAIGCVSLPQIEQNNFE
jgi:hypothetical protein